MKDLQPVFMRENVIQTTRSFFIENGFHEVITPILNSSLPTEPNIFPFSTQWITQHGNRDLYLSTSPESGLKKMLAMGIQNCFSISKCFRNLEGSGSLHIPEFLMLEWYRKDADYRKIMGDINQLVVTIKHQVDRYLNRPETNFLEYQGKTINLEQDIPVLSLVDLYKKYSGLILEEMVLDNNLFEQAEKKGYTIEGATWSSIFDQIFVNEIEPHLPSSPVFLIDFPARISPLCKVHTQKPYLAERFEFFMFGMELANGNNENTNAESIRRLFESERADRNMKGFITPPIDQEFIQALTDMADKNYAGVGLGIDRLAMIMANTQNIHDIELLCPR